MILLNILWWIIIVQAIMSWLIGFNVINLHNDLVRSVWYALEKMTEPLYRPIRKIMPDFGALDLSPLVVLLVIYILQTVILPNIAMSLVAPTTY
ncbi:MAG TPA: YggT family protein [Sphingomonas sp.]|nr:YggT family protein [Sphingomonas sp.]